MERWAPVAGYGGLYEVSDAGSVRQVKGTPRRRAWHPLPQARKSNGYMVVALADGSGKFVNRLVHRLVAETFLGPARGREVNHKNGDKTDNRVENLEWVTHAENQAHARAVLRRWVGRKGTGRKLTDEQVRAIRGSSRTYREIAAEYGVSEPTVSNIKNGRIYKEVE